MHIIIAGGGTNGRKLVELFKGHPQYRLTVIESETKKCELISEMFPFIDIILGDATYPKTIKEAMNKNTKAFIAVTGHDYLNLLSSKAAHKLGIEKVILRLNNPEYKELGRLMELTDILDPADAISAQVITHLNGVDFATLIHDIHLDLELKRITVNTGSPLLYQKPTQLQELDGNICYPILIQRKGKYQLPPAIESLQLGDCLIYWNQDKEKKKKKTVMENLFPVRRGERDVSS